MQQLNGLAAFVLACCLTVLLSGCGGSSQPARFYLLSTAADGQALEPGQRQSPSVLVGPVTLPAYLDREQIVARGQDNELEVHEFTRWAEPLRNSLKRVFINHLSALLATAEIYDLDQRQVVATDFQVMIDISRFEAKADGTPVLAAYWSILASNGEQLLRKKTVLQAESAASDLQQTIVAQNGLLLDFSREIAGALKSLVR